MRPGAYIQIELLAAEAGSGMSLPALRGEAFGHLHRQFARSPGRYALAIPRERFGALRVFATSRDDLRELADALGAAPWFRDYARILAAQDVPEGYDGPRVAFVRWRIPTVKSDRHASDGVSALRARRLAAARDRRLDHFQVRSSSTGSRFSLTVERIEGADLPGAGVPNSYGLCSRAALLGLPDFA